jgi:hypothetical protein
MSDPAQPPKGSMFLYDYATAPLPPANYRLEAATNVTFDGGAPSLKNASYFQVAGPRFTLPPDFVAGVFPPANGHGPFADGLAQIVIKRRTLPWERPLDAGKPIAPPSDGQGLPPGYPAPWMGLLLFEEGEYTLLQNVPLENVVPADVFNRLHNPPNILCDAVEADASLVAGIMPSREELQLLAHVRSVNIDDRELNVEGSDGWFAVVVTNRVPNPGKKYRACLVSLEERSDLVLRDPPPTMDSKPVRFTAANTVRDANVGLSLPRILEPRGDLEFGKLVTVLRGKTRMVLLYSWQFTCEGVGTFYELMQNLDVGMTGKVEKPGQPALTDTGHLRLPLEDRGGTEEVAWYRGPLVPFQLTRDPLGPYHSADQARRATPETGAEDVSYAAAFETGRLLAAADGRLAQELMRWRRESFKQSARATTLSAVQKSITLQMPATIPEQLHVPLPPVVAASSISRCVSGSGPIADRYGLKAAGGALGMNPKALSAAWGLASVTEAQTMLGGSSGATGLEVKPPAQTPRKNTTLEAEAANNVALTSLNNSRDRILGNLKIRTGGNK